MTNELCTNMRNQHLCISYITRGYSNQILLCCAIFRMVSSCIQVKWKPTPLSQKINNNIKNKKQKTKTKTKTKQINKHKPKQKDKEQT